MTNSCPYLFSFDKVNGKRVTHSEGRSVTILAGKKIFHTESLNLLPVFIGLMKQRMPKKNLPRVSCWGKRKAGGLASAREELKKESTQSSTIYRTDQSQSNDRSRTSRTTS